MARSSYPQLKIDAAVIGGGMDLVVSPMFANPGTARLAYNYEYSVTGGADRIRGIEPYDGHASPSAATYGYLQCSSTVTGAALGNTLTGLSSGATGIIVYLSGVYIGVTAVTGAFTTEVVQVGGITVGTVVDAAAPVDGFLDNTISKAAADYYQTFIAKVPGSGPVRGVKVINDVVYAWRDNVGATAMVIYKATASGWSSVTLYQQISFTAGSAVYAEGSTLSQGGVTATVKRVVLESGGWATADAAGRLIITTPSGGAFAAGAAGGGGACTLSGPSTQITLLPGGTVVGDVHAFSSTASKRMYGCDGVNPEFEFGDDILVPLNTGTSVRATWALCHRQALYFALKTSVLAGGPGTPYKWSSISGAAELGAGDTVNCLLTVGGGTDAPAMMVLCQSSLHVLYGSSTADWILQPLSKTSGGQFWSAVDIGGCVAVDTPGVVRYPASKNFGNFSWDTVSMQIQPIARNQQVQCAAFITGLYKYRIFFKDGSAISGLPTKDGEAGAAQGITVNQFIWSVIDYGIKVVCIEHADINKVARTFYGDDQGWVYEADVGRSFAGGTITAGMKLLPLMQKSPMVVKQFRYGDLEVIPTSASTLYTSAEFVDNDDDSMAATSSQAIGPGAFYDISNYDASYYDSAETKRLTVPWEGDGTGIVITIASSANNELTHQIQGLTVAYNPRRVKR